VIVAHELLDNLPFRLTRGHDEIRIDLDGDALVERRVPPSEGLMIVGETDDPDEERVVPVGMWAAFARILDTLERGYALLIDYGDDGPSGPVHGYRQQQPIDDLLAAPGTTDITAGVDFRWIVEAARERGLQALGPTDQAAVLRALGFDAWLRDELEVQREQLATGAGLDAVRTWSGRSLATLLVDPSGLGRMRWLLLATPGLPGPDWLSAGVD
jgi:NADH dehydrogenase [ubiquinone] 1 alpha subcomplex assembly factor 7